MGGSTSAGLSGEISLRPEFLALFFAGFGGSICSGLSKQAPLLSFYIFVPNYGELKGNAALSNYIFANTVIDDLDENAEIPFYIAGKEIFQSVNIIPSEPTVVIKENERIIAKQIDDKSEIYLETIFLGSVLDNDFHKIKSKEAIPFEIYQEIMKEGSIESRSCQRDLYDFEWDGVQRVLFHEALENWFTGGPELRISCQTVNNLATTQAWNLPYSDNHDWVLIDAQFFIWSEEEGNPNRVKYHFSEADGTSDTGKFKLSLSAEVDIPFIGSVKFSPEYTFGNESDDLYGECLEYYCEWVDPTTWGNDHQVGSDFICWMNIIQ